MSTLKREREPDVWERALKLRISLPQPEYYMDSLDDRYGRALEAVGKNGMILSVAEEWAIRNKEIVYAAVRQNKDAIQFAHGTVQMDEDIYSLVFKKFDIRITRNKGNITFRFFE